jgi:ammonia channel protein AmtB
LRVNLFALKARTLSPSCISFFSIFCDMFFILWRLTCVSWFFFTFSSAYHPETNGLVARFNQTLQNMLAKVCPDENDWDLYLDEVTFSYRSMNQKSTKTSPFQVMFGRNLEHLFVP